MAPRPFRRPPQDPPLFTGTPESVVRDTTSLIERSKALTDKIVSELNPQTASFQNVIRPVAYNDNNDGLEANILTFYQSVAASKALRDASEKAQNLLKDFSVESSMREDMFKLVEAIHQKKEDLHPESRKLLEESYKDYIRNGVGLPVGPKRDRFMKIQKRLGQLTTQFDRNLSEESGGIWFTPAELEGVPRDVMKQWAKGEGENAGRLKMPFTYPNLFPLMKNAVKEATRKSAFLANENKMPQNLDIFREVILLRDEAARILGYPDHAAIKIENKMAKSPKTVDDFLGGLRLKLTKRGESEREALAELKKQDSQSRGVDFDGHYFLWDHQFYNRLMLERDYKIDQEKLAEYFPLTTTLRGMLEIFEHLLGLVFIEVTGEDRAVISPTGKGEDIVWHEECYMFSVWNSEGEGDEFVGYLYLDLHPRDEKYKHAANFNLQYGFIKEDGSRRYPATSLVCNFSRAKHPKPSLLKHEELTTLFHELGHGIHDLVSKTKYSTFHGTNVVRDFVEAPSQMLENWCWTPKQLKSLSHHYSALSPEYEAAWQAEAPKDTPLPREKLSDEDIDNLIKTRHVNGALFNLRQLHFGIFDMKMYEPKSHEEAEAFKISEIYNKLEYDLRHIDSPAQLGQGWDWGNGHSTFGHIIAGYDAGYYGYLYSQVYSLDMFHSVFAKDPMNATEGRRYRHMVLEKGGSVDAIEMLRAFLGREPSSAAFYKELGIE